MQILAQTNYLRPQLVVQVLATSVMRPVIKRTKKVVVLPICMTYVFGHETVKVITRIPTCISYYLMNGILVFLGHEAE